MFLTQPKKDSFVEIFILNELINVKEYPSVLEGDDSILESAFVKLLTKGYITLYNNKYITTNDGRTIFSNFMKRYDEYLKLYDIFAS